MCVEHRQYERGQRERRQAQRARVGHATHRRSDAPFLHSPVLVSDSHRWLLSTRRLGPTRDARTERADDSNLLRPASPRKDSVANWWWRPARLAAGSIGSVYDAALMTPITWPSGSEN